MKQLSLLFQNLMLLMAIVAMALPARADRTVNQLQFGKQTIEVAADEVITFYDMNGYQGISSSSSNNSQSLTVFKPAEGKAIQLTFERLDVRNDGASWPAYVNVYAGDPDADNSFNYATTTSDVTAAPHYLQVMCLRSLTVPMKTRPTLLPMLRASSQWVIFIVMPKPLMAGRQQ